MARNETESMAKFSRRSFLKATAAGMAAAAAVASGCAPSNEPLSGTGEEGAIVNAAALPEQSVDRMIAQGEGSWLPFACETGNGCAGRCRKFAYVVDDAVVRIKTDESEEDSSVNPQRRACLKGRARRQEIFGPSRIRYPMKRKGWKPGGGANSNGEMRGKDEWEIISWDEALDLAASEIKRIYESYGPTAVLGSTYADPYKSIMCAMGGYVDVIDTQSPGASGVGTLYFGANALGIGGLNDFQDYVNADYIVFEGANVGWSAQSHLIHFQEAKERGAKFISIGPDRNATASQLEALWIPVRPGTDTAFLLGVMGEMVKLDDEQGGVIDHDFLDKYCVGFDDAHMPADAKLKESFEGYLRGTYDGVEKNAEWATIICGTPVDLIKEFAQICAKDNNVAYIYSCGAARNVGAENFPQAVFTLAWMGGHVGRPGNCIGNNMFAFGIPGQTVATSASGTCLPQENPTKNIYLHAPVMWRSILQGKTVCYEDEASPMPAYHPGVEHDIDIKMILNGTNNYFNAKIDAFNAVRVFRQCEFVMASGINATTPALYSDIVLPTCSPWEGDLQENVWPSLAGDTSELGSALGTALLPARTALVPPLYEAKSRTQLAMELAERLGLDTSTLFVNEAQAAFDCLASAVSMDAAGEATPIIGFTQDVIDEFGVVLESREGLIDYRDFIEQGGYQVRREEGDAFSKNYGYLAYITDPEANPIPTTPSGKFEIYCQTKADVFNASGLSEEPIKPYPNYFVPTSGYEHTFADWDAQVKGDYPFQIFNLHHLRRIHSSDYEPWVQDAFKAPVYISLEDAEAKGLKAGDTIELTSPHGGRMRRKCQPMASVMPGCVGLTHGGHLKLDESDPDNWVDIGSCDNSLTAPVMSNYMPSLSGYNNAVVNFEKCDVEVDFAYDSDPFENAK
ncbi:molybdopterin-dependent oxidoreductase [Adlercreutzia equolifaciens]|uniref:molybdopterin-dependent oxidoreductase n=1 Tax=Adlercreutzia equolifaciens TaxID=446660 RepID=UPI0023B0F537|nr:molybdopterin-dependent oxidoreductase [Adlercreutzia equolifaciens]MDE8702678.1 molybdopterin-dependent oxidoreductase [Adlercreutzia equolifaciens]